MFILQYQSSDGSQWDEAVSKNTEKETAGKAITHVRSSWPWLLRLPTYHSTDVSALLQQKNAYIFYNPDCIELLQSGSCTHC